MATNEGGTAVVLDRESGQVLYELPAVIQTHSLAWSPDSSQLAVAQPGGTVTILDGLTGTALQMLTGHLTSNLWLLWSPDGKSLASWAHGQDGTLRVWNIGSGEQ